MKDSFKLKPDMVASSTSCFVLRYTAARWFEMRDAETTDIESIVSVNASTYVAMGVFSSTGKTTPCSLVMIIKGSA